MNLLKDMNIGLAFILELCGTIALSYWGFTFSGNKITKILLGVGLPLLLIIIWGIWCAPSSEHRLVGISLIVVKCLLFGIIALCIIHRHYAFLGVLFAALVVFNLGVSAYFRTL